LAVLRSKIISTGSLGGRRKWIVRKAKVRGVAGWRGERGWRQSIKPTNEPEQAETIHARRPVRVKFRRATKP